MPISMSMNSPLRYPGSKASLVDYISILLKENYLEGCHFIEPYAGSAIVSLELLKKSLISKATILEKDPLVYAFWHSVFTNPYALIEKLYKLPINLDTWYKFQKYREAEKLESYPILEMGLAGLFFNRTNFSGILKAGPIGGRKQESRYKLDCRFNKNRLIQQIADLSTLSNHITVIYDDALDYLNRERKQFKNEECFFYIDPPYYEKGKSLYRYWYNHDDHKKLAHFLTRCDTPWLVSYDNHENIRKIYRRANLVEVYFDYTVSQYRKEREILISNIKIPPGTKELFKDSLA